MTTALATRLHAITEATRLTHDEIGTIVDATSRSVGRWTTGATEPQRTSRQRLLELAYVADELRDVLRADDANLWIMSPNRLLDGDSPAERIGRGEFRSVVGVIEALADGIVV